MPGRQLLPGWRAPGWQAPAAPAAGPAGSPDDRSWRPRSVSHLVVSGLFAAQLAGIFAARGQALHGSGLAFAVVAATLLYCGQQCIAWRGALNWSWPLRLSVLTALGVLTYLPLLTAGVLWPGMAGFFAGSLMILRPVRTSWALFALVVASMLAAPLALGRGAADATYLMIASLSGGLAIFGVYQLRVSIKLAQGASARLAQHTSARERERFSRDLHDILGYSLSAITLRAELARKLTSSDPALAQDELAEVLDLARQAAADVRLMASGYSCVSLAREAATAASLLSAACITPRVAIDCGSLDDTVDTVLAIVLREAVTNVLRHSSASSCVVEAFQDGKTVTLTVINDGVRAPVQSGTSGHGLRNLSRRLEAIGGKLSTEDSGDDQFSLLATVPARAKP